MREVSDLSRAVTDAAARPEVRRAVEQVYAELAAAVDERRPVCTISGRCCRFEGYGHRLYVTTAELAAFLYGMAKPVQADGGLAREGDSSRTILPIISSPPNTAAWDGTGCPFQIDKLCGVHALRPMGCRMFFCDATSTEWQNETYERLHASLKRLHENLEVPYFYVEWRQALCDLGLAVAPTA